MSIIKGITCIAKYSRKGLCDGIFKSNPRKFLKMASCATPKEVVNVPLSCFGQTKKGDIVLYRGLQNVYPTQEPQYNLSVAAINGVDLKSILKDFGKKTKKTIANIANYFSGLTQGNDPILHTTTKRAIAKRFTRNGGTLVEYHIPKSYIQKKGIVGHLGEEEIDFLHSIPKKFIAKVTEIKPKKISYGELPPPPEFIII